RRAGYAKVLYDHRRRLVERSCRIGRRSHHVDGAEVLDVTSRGHGGKAAHVAEAEEHRGHRGPHPVRHADHPPGSITTAFLEQTPCGRGGGREHSRHWLAELRSGGHEALAYHRHGDPHAEHGCEPRLPEPYGQDHERGGDGRSQPRRRGREEHEERPEAL